MTVTNGQKVRQECFTVPANGECVCHATGRN